jgi:hypothetical protein
LSVPDILHTANQEIGVPGQLRPAASGLQGPVVQTKPIPAVAAVGSAILPVFHHSSIPTSGYAGRDEAIPGSSPGMAFLGEESRIPF